MKKGMLAIGATILAAGALSVATAGADINISIPTNTTQDAKLARVLTYLNQDREVPYADVDEMAEDRLTRDLKQLVRMLDEREHKAIFTAWESADESVKDQVKALLGVP